MAGQIGNTNALKTGKRTNRTGAVLNRLGKRHEPIYRNILAMRRGLESQVKAARGRLSQDDYTNINEACRFEVTAEMSYWLIANHDDLPPAEIANHLKNANWATQQRNAVLARLNLDPATASRHNSPSLSRVPIIDPAALYADLSAPSPAAETSDHEGDSDHQRPTRPPTLTPDPNQEPQL